MRRTTRLLAAVKPARFLEPNTPTGLTGLFTHAAPRSTLIYIYSATLDKLKTFPEDSVYRKSTENLTQHRLKIISSIKPAGYDEWSAKAEKIIAENPEVFNTPEGGVDFDSGKHLKEIKDGKSFVTTRLDDELDELTTEWDGEVGSPELEGTRTKAEREGQVVLGLERPGEDFKQIRWEPEPPLDSDQITDIENQIGAGLIEEVIQVAEGELKLVDVMAQAKVWEDLEEKPAEGQWNYFARGTAVPTTQPPPQKS